VWVSGVEILGTQRPVVFGFVLRAESRQQRAILDSLGRSFDDRHSVAAFKVYDKRRIDPGGGSPGLELYWTGHNRTLRKPRDPRRVRRRPGAQSFLTERVDLQRQGTLLATALVPRGVAPSVRMGASAPRPKRASAEGRLRRPLVARCGSAPWAAATGDRTLPATTGRLARSGCIPCATACEVGAASHTLR
jgi:hypothetical protein